MSQIAHDLSRSYTVAEVLEFPNDGNRYELIEGELLVSPSPRYIHQAVLSTLHYRLRTYLEPFGLGHTVLFAPADITWGSRTLVQPDLFVVRPEEISARWTTVQHLRLAVEVLSPSTAGYDRIKKRHLYQKRGVETYWIVDPDEQCVEVWTPHDTAPIIVQNVLEWTNGPEEEVLRISVPELFASAGGITQ